MLPFRIIGIGSAFGDDQFGWSVITQLHTVRPVDIPIDLLQCASPASELLGLLRGAEYVILIDAVHSQLLPVGTLSCWQRFDELPAQGLSSHGVDLATILQLTEILGQKTRWKIYGVEIGLESLSQMNCPLSEPVAAVIPSLIQQIQQDISNYGSGV
jgi:hydrogenase maturation protease